MSRAARGLLLAVLTASLPSAAPAVTSPSPLDPIVEEVLVNKKKKLCLDPEGENAASRAVVSLAPCDGKPDQRWRWVPAGNDAFEIRNAKSGLCLDVKGYDADEKDPVILYACDKHEDQRWRRGDDGRITNDKGVIMVFNGGLPMTYVKCLDFPGTDGSAGDEARIYRCDGSADQSFSGSATGTKTTATGSGSATKLCGSSSGPCVEGSWVASGSTYTGSGKLTVAQLPGGAASMSLDAKRVAANVGADFAVVGQSGLNATLPGSVALNLPLGALELGYGAGITKLLGDDLEIGGESYALQPSSVYVHSKTDFTGTIEVAGLTASFPVPGTKSEEFLVGLGTDGPSLYFSGDCNVVLPPIAAVSACTLGWFGPRTLKHTLAVAILDPAAALPDVGSSLPTVSPTVNAAILLGGDVTFTAIPALGFSGMVAVDPGGGTLQSLSGAKLGLEGSTAIGVGPFSMQVGSASLLYDVARKRVDLGAEIPALDPFKAIGSAIGSKVSGKATAYGRFGATTNQLVFDFSKAKLFGFDLDRFQGQTNFDEKTLGVAGKIEIGESWTKVTGTFGGPDVVALTSGSALELGGKTLTSSSVTVSLSGVRVRGTVNLSGKQWTFDETLTTPRTIKSGTRDVSVSVPGVGSVGFELWAQYTMGGSLSVKARASQSLFGASASQVYDVDTDGNIELGGGVKIPAW